MTQDEGIKLLSLATSGSANLDSTNFDSTDSGSADTGAAKVVTTLGCLALALDQAGAYIRARKLSLSQFIAHYKKRKISVLKEIPDEWEYQDPHEPDNIRPLSAFTTWEMSLDLIKGANEKEKKQKVQFLTLASFLDPYQISESYFRMYGATSNTDWLGLFNIGGEWDSNELADLLTDFLRLSLIQSFERREGGQYLFSIHPLICDWIRFRRATDARSTIIELTNILATFLQTHDVNYLPLELNQEMTRHMNAWIEVNEDVLQDSYEAVLSANNEAVRIFADFYNIPGLYNEAEQLYVRALQGREEKLGPEHPDALRRVQDLAVVYWNQGRYDEAEQLYMRALQGREEKLGPKHPDTLRTVQNLAGVYNSQGRYDEAEQLYMLALQGREEKLGPKQPDTLRTAQNLAVTYWNQGRYDEAEQLFMRALQGREKRLGPKHPDTLRTVQNLYTFCIIDHHFRPATYPRMKAPFLTPEPKLGAANNYIGTRRKMLVGPEKSDSMLSAQISRH